MAKYYYKSRDRTGVITNGNLHAANPWQARKVLNKSHLTVISLSRFDLKLMIADLRIGLEKMTSKISFEEKMVLFKPTGNRHFCGNSNRANAAFASERYQK